MEDFLTIFEPLEAHGPGTREDTLAVIELLPSPPESILDIGCGPGNATLTLAQHTRAHIHALDNLDQSLERLAQRASKLGLEARITTVNGDMEELPVPQASFDAIWCENSVYVVGFERALTIWKPFLKDRGMLVVSDLVWLRDEPATDVHEFWQGEYPDMTDLAERKKQIEVLGYDLVATHTLGHEAWASYYGPLARRIDEVRDEMKGSAAVVAIEREIEILRRQAEGDFSYVFFVMQPRR